MRRLLLVIILISTLILLPFILLHARSEILKFTALALMAIVIWRWIAWVRHGNPHYLDLGVEWALIITSSIAVGDSFATLSIIYTAFYFRPLVGTARWALVGAVGSTVALTIGTHYAGHPTVTATSLDLLGQFPLFTAAAAIGFFLAHIVHRQKHQTVASQRAEKRFRSLVGQLPQTVFTATPDGITAYMSPQVEQIFGRVPEEFVGKSWQMMTALLHPSEHQQFVEAVEESIRETTALVTDLRFQLESRGTVWVRVSVHPVRDSSGEVEYWLGTMTDITTQQQLENKLTYMAFHDDLTGLPNRALFDDRLELAIARSTRSGSGLAVLFLDLDNFKLVNDSLGHAFGDDLIQRVGERLQSAIRETDTVARLGGDEFMIVLEDIADEESAIQVAKTILARLEPELSLHGERIRVNASIGIAWSATPHPTADDLVRYADLAMYVAKHEGIGQYAVYRPHMSDAALEQFRGGSVRG